MRYKIIAEDDESYQHVVRYLGTHQPGHVKVRLPDRRVLSAENLTVRTIDALKKIGARVSEEFQYSIDRNG
ncbi:MAG TPA: hypothetical protein VM733_03575 [Thermoanaerobaculia bacterium]|nr:hypothetical protein [Thermoanaerobaculia bacterium]